MKKFSHRCRTAGVMLAALTAFAAQAQMKVGVIASSTGPTAVVGIPQKNSAALLPKKIGVIDVEYIVYDDASDPTGELHQSPAAQLTIEQSAAQSEVPREMDRRESRGDPVDGKLG